VAEAREEVKVQGEAEIEDTSVIVIYLPLHLVSWTPQIIERFI
jgi:hypothetical protein